MLVDSAEDLDVAMLMYNLIEYSKKYRNTIGSLWSYYRDKPVYPITDSESFKFKKFITGKTANNGNTKRGWICWIINKYKQYLENIRYVID